MEQPTLFSFAETAPDDMTIALHALADFQARGLALAGRDLPLDRLRGALRRAAEALATTELTDERAAAALQELGAQVRRVPVFVAKHPFRVIIPEALAERARQLASGEL